MSLLHSLAFVVKYMTLCYNNITYNRVGLKSGGYLVISTAPVGGTGLVLTLG